MAKRVASTELTQDNWAKEDEPEEMGKFRQATSQELAGRQIKQARRRCLGGDTSTPTVCKGLSAFTGFSGSMESSSQPSFSFLSKNNSSESPVKPAFDFLSSSNSSTNSQSSKHGLSSSENKLATQPFKFTQESVSTVSKTVEPPKNNGVEETNASSDSSSRGGSKLFLAHLKALNEGVVLWVKEHLDKNPHVNLSPVFDDYKKHFEELTRKYPPESGTESESEVGSTAKSSKMDEASEKENKPLLSQEVCKESVPVKNFSFTGSTTASSEKSSEISKSLFTFGSTAGTVEAQKKSDSEVKPTFTFGGFDASNKKSDGLIFGGSINSASKGFVFGGLSSSQPSSLAPSSFFPSSSTHAAAESNSVNVDVNEPNDEPPEVQVNEVKEEDALYEKKCKLFYMKDGAYIEKGVGTLFLKPAGEKTQLVIRALTNLGNILLNIILNASIPTIRAGKNGVMIACVPNPPLTAKSDNTEPVKMLIRVKTGEDADNLLEKINELKK